MSKKKNKKKQQNPEVETKVIPLDDQDTEETQKSNKFEFIGKCVVGAGVGLLGVGAAVYGFIRGKKKNSEEAEESADYQEVEDLPDLDEEAESEE